MGSRARCSGCGRFLVLAGTGRPKLYCGARCRVRAYRERQREAHAAPLTLHAALGTEPATRLGREQER